MAAKKTAEMKLAREHVAKMKGRNFQICFWQDVHLPRQ